MAAAGRRGRAAAGRPRHGTAADAGDHPIHLPGWVRRREGESGAADCARRIPSLLQRPTHAATMTFELPGVRLAGRAGMVIREGGGLAAARAALPRAWAPAAAPPGAPDAASEPRSTRRGGRRAPLPPPVGGWHAACVRRGRCLAQSGRRRLGGRAGQRSEKEREGGAGSEPARRSPNPSPSSFSPPQDVTALSFTNTPRGLALAVARRPGPGGGAGPQFLGLARADADAVKAAAAAWPAPPSVTEGDGAVSGANWGALALQGGDVVLSSAAGSTLLRLPLADVTGVASGRDEVAFELAPDDTGVGGERDDSLVGVTLHIPRAAKVAGVAPDPASALAPAAAFADAARELCAAGGEGDEAAATFENAALLQPRGRFDVELHAAHARLAGGAADYRVPYAAVARLLVLPRPHSPHTLVAVQLDPPLRKGATTYPFLLFQFPDDDELDITLALPADVLAAKNAACGGRLPERLAGSAPDVFARALRGLAGAKLVRTGAFRAADGVSAAVRASLRADDGYLYLLDKAAFYGPKPPTLLPFDDVASVEFVRRGGGVLASSQKTFDLAIRPRAGPELLFRGVARGEWQNLLAFFQAKGVRVDNVRDAAAGAGGGGRALDVGGARVDAGLARMDAEGGGGADDDDEEDADFEAGGEGEGEDDDDDSAASSDEDGGEAKAAAPAPKKKAKKEAPPPSGEGKPKVREGGGAGRGDEGGRARTPRAHPLDRRPNAPRRTPPRPRRACPPSCSSPRRGAGPSKRPTRAPRSATSANCSAPRGKLRAPRSARPLTRRPRPTRTGTRRTWWRGKRRRERRRRPRRSRQPPSDGACNDRGRERTPHTPHPTPSPRLFMRPPPPWRRPPPPRRPCRTSTG